MTDELAAFLRARLDEDERFAARLGDRRFTLVPIDPHAGPVDGQQRGMVDVVTAEDGSIALFRHPMFAEHFTRQGPARVLRDIEARRALVFEHADEGGDCRVCARPSNETNELGYAFHEPLPYPCRTVRLLALPYADHPDYREEWRP